MLPPHPPIQTRKELALPEQMFWKEHQANSKPLNNHYFAYFQLSFYSVNYSYLAHIIRIIKNLAAVSRKIRTYPITSMNIGMKVSVHSYLPWTHPWPAGLNQEGQSISEEELVKRKAC